MKSWKSRTKIPRFLQTALRRGLKLADTINVEEANDKSWIRITFKKLPASPEKGAK